MINQIAKPSFWSVCNSNVGSVDNSHIATSSAKVDRCKRQFQAHPVINDYIWLARYDFLLVICNAVPLGLGGTVVEL